MTKQLVIEAIDLAIAGNWDEAHEIVQDLENKYAYWIHAVLHRIEGDHSNARYWYTRAKQAYSTIPPEEEFLLIKANLIE